MQERVRLVERVADLAGLRPAGELDQPTAERVSESRFSRVLT